MENKRILLDTNIIIHRESSKKPHNEIGKLFWWIEELHCKKIIHSISIEEIHKYNSKDVKDIINIKLDNYNKMDSREIISKYFLTLIKDFKASPNSDNDNELLYLVYEKKVDIFITEDIEIIKKAQKLKLFNKVFRIDDFINWCNNLHPKLIEYKNLNVTVKKMSEINLHDGFFDSLRENYDGFNLWFKNRFNKEAYIVEDNKKIIGFLYLKIEDNESYNDIEPKFSVKKRLKIGTFKIESTGYRLGERFFKIIFDNAIKNKVDEIYVTLFKENVNLLYESLVKWGFDDWGNKINKGKIEHVMVKKLKTFHPNKTAQENFPFYSKESNKFFLPIKKEWHDSLFLDAIENFNKSFDYIGSKIAHQYAIKKIYITKYKHDNLPKEKDIILIYSIGDYPKKENSMVTSICIINKIYSCFSSKEEFLDICSNRSVFSKEDLNNFANNFNDYIIIELLFHRKISKIRKLKYLWENSIIEFQKGPRIFMPIKEEDFKKIIGGI